MIRERFLIFIINTFCPPLSVMLIAGPGMDCLINTLFFLAGVIPGHIHGFYISCTYFHRKRKVRMGKWPGGWERFIYSEDVVNGGASEERVRELWKEKRRAERRTENHGRRLSTRTVGRGEVGGDVVEGTWDGRRESRRAVTRNGDPRGSTRSGSS